MIVGGEKVFLDTDVLVYADVTQERCGRSNLL